MMYVYLSSNLRLSDIYYDVIKDNSPDPELPDLRGDSNSPHDFQEPEDVCAFKFKLCLV
jgi:hypothetical protein